MDSTPEKLPETPPNAAQPAAEPASKTLSAFEPIAKDGLERLERFQTLALKHGTARFGMSIAGVVIILGLAYRAAWEGNWSMVEKLALPALTFFVGLLAGGKSG